MYKNIYNSNFKLYLIGSGYNLKLLSDFIHDNKLQKKISEFLSANGYTEHYSNSLISERENSLTSLLTSAGLNFLKTHFFPLTEEKLIFLSNF